MTGPLFQFNRRRLRAHCGRVHTHPAHGLQPHVYAPHGFQPHVYAPQGLQPHVYAPHGLQPHGCTAVVKRTSGSNRASFRSGKYHVGGFFNVPVAPGRSYREEAGPSATYELKRFTVTPPNPNSDLSEMSWGSVKAVADNSSLR